jgi:hypothetical protein
VLLPLSLENNYTAEVLVCGGSKFKESPSRDDPADDSCGRIRPLDANPQWVMETMPDPRIVPDGIITANGQASWIGCCFFQISTGLWRILYGSSVVDIPCYLV